MQTAYLLTGSNLGDRLSHLKQAVLHLTVHTAVEIDRISQVYETAPWGKTDQQSFYNQALKIKTSLSAIELLDLVLDIEQRIGRKRKERWGPRCIDIDIIFYEDEISKTRQLELPHPRLQDRRFVLVPMVELTPNHLHPVFQKTVSELLEECKDQLAVTLL